MYHCVIIYTKEAIVLATKKPRYMISVDDDMFNEIEDFRFEQRFQTRSEATTELIRLGLEALKREAQNKATQEPKKK